MEAQVPSPQTTLLILLGASEWPLFPEFQGSEAFAKAARGLKAYFLDPKRFGLSEENVFDVFNSNHSADELDAQIAQFLERRLAALKATGYAARDLLVYFVGHGGFVGRDSDFYLAIRRTREENPRASGIPMLSLADTLTEKARYLRRIIILDCCFAAAAFSAFQAGPAQVALEKTIDAFEVKQRGVGFPTKGTTLLCSSSQKSPSLLLPDGSSTMFTKALLDALATGISSPRDRLSLREVKDVAAGFLSETRNAPRPVVLSPDQSEGDIADIPFFPNPRATELVTPPSQASLSPVELASPFPTEVASPSRPSAALTTRRRGFSWIKMTLLIALALFIVGGASVLYTTVNTYYAHVSATATATAAGNAYATAVTKHGIMFGFDAQHTRTNPYEIILSANNVAGLIQAWAAPTGSAIYSSPAVAGDVVYVGSDDFKLYAFNAQTGATLWTSTTGGAIGSSPAVANGVVYVGSTDGKLYAFDAVSGTQKWASPTGSAIYSSPAVANGVIYVGSDDNKLYAFDAASGTQKWASPTGGRIFSSPAVADSVIYVGSEDGKLYAFDAATGVLKWASLTGVKISESSPAVLNGVVYVCSWDHELHAFDAATGAQKWASSPTGDIITSSPAVANGVVYVGSGDGKLYAFDAVSGTQKWASPTGGYIKSSPAVANGVVYVSSSDGKLYAFNAATGVQKWTSSAGIDTGDTIYFSSPAVANGVVYVGSTGGELYAFHLPGTAS